MSNETVSTENYAPTYVPISAEEARQVRSNIQDMGKLYDWIRAKSKITTDQFVHSQCLLNEAQIEELRNLGYNVKQPLPTSNYHEISW